MKTTESNITGAATMLGGSGSGSGSAGPGDGVSAAGIRVLDSKEQNYLTAVPVYIEATHIQTALTRMHQAYDAGGMRQSCRLLESELQQFIQDAKYEGGVKILGGLGSNKVVRINMLNLVNRVTGLNLNIFGTTAVRILSSYVMDYKKTYLITDPSNVIIKDYQIFIASALATMCLKFSRNASGAVEEQLKDLEALYLVCCAILQEPVLIRGTAKEARLDDTIISLIKAIDTERRRLTPKIKDTQLSEHAQALAETYPVIIEEFKRYILYITLNSEIPLDFLEQENVQAAMRDCPTFAEYKRNRSVTEPYKRVFKNEKEYQVVRAFIFRPDLFAKRSQILMSIGADASQVAKMRYVKSADEKSGPSPSPSPSPMPASSSSSSSSLPQDGEDLKQSSALVPQAGGQELVDDYKAIFIESKLEELLFFPRPVQSMLSSEQKLTQTQAQHYQGLVKSINEGFYLLCRELGLKFHLDSIVKDVTTFGNHAPLVLAEKISSQLMIAKYVLVTMIQILTDSEHYAFGLSQSFPGDSSHPVKVWSTPNLALALASQVKLRSLISRAFTNIRRVEQGNTIEHAVERLKEEEQSIRICLSDLKLFWNINARVSPLLEMHSWITQEAERTIEQKREYQARIQHVGVFRPSLSVGPGARPQLLMGGPGPVVQSEGKREVPQGQRSAQPRMLSALENFVDPATGLTLGQLMKSAEIQQAFFGADVVVTDSQSQPVSVSARDAHAIRGIQRSLQEASDFASTDRFRSGAGFSFVAAAGGLSRRGRGAQVEEVTEPVAGGRSLSSSALSSSSTTSSSVGVGGGGDPRLFSSSTTSSSLMVSPSGIQLSGTLPLAPSRDLVQQHSGADFDF